MKIKQDDIDRATGYSDNIIKNAQKIDNEIFKTLEINSLAQQVKHIFNKGTE